MRVLKLCLARLFAATLLVAAPAGAQTIIPGGGSGGFTPGVGASCGTVSVSTICFPVTATWATSGTYVAPLTVSVTDSGGANAASRYFTITGGASGTTDQFAVLKGGIVQVPPTAYLTVNEGGNAKFGFLNDNIPALLGPVGDLRLNTDGSLGLGVNARLYGEAANTLALRFGTSAQTFNVYNTYTDGSNYERGVVGWISTANSFEIGTEASGTGTARNVLIKSASGVININGSLALSPGNTITGGGGIAGTVVTGSTWLVASPKTVSGLALCNAAGDGAISWVTDSTLTFSSANFGAAVTGGGTNHVPVRCDGSGTPAWKIG